MRTIMGLHTKEEAGHVLDLETSAYNRALDAVDRREPVAVIFELGYIKAISDLADAQIARGPSIPETRGLSLIAKDHLRWLDVELKKIS